MNESDFTPLHSLTQQEKKEGKETKEDGDKNSDWEASIFMSSLNEEDRAYVDARCSFYDVYPEWLSKESIEAGIIALDDALRIREKLGRVTSLKDPEERRQKLENAIVDLKNLADI